MTEVSFEPQNLPRSWSQYLQADLSRVTGNLPAANYQGPPARADAFEVAESCLGYDPKEELCWHIAEPCTYETRASVWYNI